MPTTKNAFARYKVLDKLLSDSHHNYSVADMTEIVNEHLADMGMYAVSRRCVEKDIHYLEFDGPFCVEIDRYKTPGYNGETGKTFTKTCLRYHNSSFSIFKKEMTDDEMYLLGEALKMLGQMDGLPNLEELENLRQGLEVNTDRQIVAMTTNPLENSTLFGQLFTDISQKLVIQVKYHRFVDQEEVRIYIVHPYLLKEYNRRWFLFAATNEENKMLCLPLDRIISATPMPGYAYRECKDNPLDYFDDIIGVTLLDNEPLQKILFWVSNKSKDYVLTKPLHDSQIHYKGQREQDLRRQYPNLHEGAFFQIQCRKNYELMRELTSYGSALLVLSPQNIVDQIRQGLKEMTDCYDTLSAL